MARRSSARRAAAGGVAAAAFAAAGFVFAGVASPAGSASVGQADPVCPAGLDFSYWTDDGVLTGVVHSTLEPVTEPLLPGIDLHGMNCAVQGNLNRLGCQVDALAFLKGSVVHETQCPSG